MQTTEKIYLFIDTTERDSFRVVLFDSQKTIAQKTVIGRRTASEKLLGTIRDLLAKKKHAIQDVSGIAVAKGPGSFTALRIGIVTANALAYGLGIPIIGTAKEFQFGDITDKLQQPNLNIANTMALPEYGSMPGIG